MNIAIVGSRTFTDYEALEVAIVNYLPAEMWPLTIISGGAKGADALAEQLAENFNLELKIFPADWDTHGKIAGFLRNQKIIDASDFVIAFWDGKSKGTKDTIDKARKAKKPTLIIYI